MMIFISFIFSVYRYVFSPILHVLGAQFFVQPGCRYYPSCSRYVFGALRRYGVLRGSIKGMRRVGFCLMFHKGGYDPA